MFSDAIIKTETNLSGLKNGITDQKKLINKVSEQMEEIKNTFMEELNKFNNSTEEKINSLETKIDQLHKVLINHATIINSIKDAITMVEQ